MKGLQSFYMLENISLNQHNFSFFVFGDRTFFFCYVYMLSLPRPLEGFGGLVVRMLASGSRVRGFKPGRSRRIFSVYKNPQRAFLRRESQIICPMSQLCGM
jgi:hypothetical protein